MCGSCFLSAGPFTGRRGPLRVICILAWVHASPARILRGSLVQVKAVMLFAWRGATRLHTALCKSIRKRRNCVARVHAGPRRSEREGLESRGKSSVGRAWYLFYCVVYDTALCMAWVHSGPAQVFCGFKRQYCLRRAGPPHRPSEARGHAGPARVPLYQCIRSLGSASCGEAFIVFGTFSGLQRMCLA